MLGRILNAKFLDISVSFLLLPCLFVSPALICVTSLAQSLFCVFFPSVSFLFVPRFPLTHTSVSFLARLSHYLSFINLTQSDGAVEYTEMLIDLKELWIQTLTWGKNYKLGRQKLKDLTLYISG